MTARSIHTAVLLLASAVACGDDDGGEPDRGDAGPCQPFPVANEGWGHVSEATDIEYRHNPPASGPHYEAWARYQVHEEPLPRGHWVHNLEHGGVVLLHRTDAPAETIAALRAAYQAIPDDPLCLHPRALVMPDPELDDQVAVVAADWAIEGDCTDQDAILDFVDQHRNRAPEQVCADGTVPP